MRTLNTMLDVRNALDAPRHSMYEKRPRSCSTLPDAKDVSSALKVLNVQDTQDVLGAVFAPFCSYSLTLSALLDEARRCLTVATL